MRPINALVPLGFAAGAAALPQLFTVTANGATETFSFSQPTAAATAFGLDKRQQFTFTNNGNTFSFSVPSFTIPGQVTSTAASNAAAQTTNAALEQRQNAFTFTNNGQTFSFNVPTFSIPGQAASSTTQAPAASVLKERQNQFTFTNSGQTFSFSVPTAVASLLA